MSLVKESSQEENQENQEIRVRFLIPKMNIKKFLNRIGALGRKAVKLGCEPIEVREGETVFKKAGKEVSPVDEREAQTFVECIEYFVVGKAPKIDGYEFIARLDHTEAGNIINTAPGKTCPTKYGHTGSYCDHCRSDRYRKKLYVLRDEKGGYSQVGRSCLKHYNGHQDPLKVSAYFEMILDLEDTLGGFSEGGREVQMYDIETILAIAVMSIGHYGFRKSNSEGGATKEDISFYLNPPTAHKEIERIEIAAEVAKLKPTDEARAKAKKVIEWVGTLGESNYEHNLKVLVAQEYVGYWNFGLLASAPWAYAKAVEDAKVEKKAAKANTFIGEKGERLDLVLTLTRSTYLGVSCYGATETERYVHNFEDAKGNVFCWFTKDINPERGDKITLKGTVKDHSDYQGRKQTVLTRCKIKDMK